MRYQRKHSRYLVPLFLTILSLASFKLAMILIEFTEGPMPIFAIRLFHIGYAFFIIGGGFFIFKGLYRTFRHNNE